MPTMAANSKITQLTLQVLKLDFKLFNEYKKMGVTYSIWIRQYLGTHHAV